MATDISNVSERIKAVREWVDQQINTIISYKYDAHRLILICSLIDAFAQNDAGYPRGNNTKHFSDFVIQYSKKNSAILSEVCPVTLFYDAFQDASIELNLPSHAILCAGNSALVNESNRLISLLPEKERDNKSCRHRYASLIYAMRNKLTHELNFLNIAPNFFADEEEQVPHVACESTIINGKLEHKAWRLHIPERFVFDVAEDAIKGYLQYCERIGSDPFYNNNYERSCFYSWH